MNELARAQSIQFIDAEPLIRVALEKGPEAVAALKELAQLHEHQQEKKFRQAFVSAFARVRAKTSVINAVKAIPDRTGNARWYYAPLEDLQDEVEPILRSEGLELRFNSRREGPQANIVVGICIIMDPATGYSEQAECGVNASNAEGGDLGALKKAKRGALTAMLGLRTRHDDDARMLGDLITSEQAAELQRRVQQLRVDERKFLAFALGWDPSDVDLQCDGQEQRGRSWKQIRQGRIGQLHDLLDQKERAATKAAD